MAFLGCDEKGRGPGPFGAVAVRTGRAQEPDDLGMSLYNRGESIEENQRSEGRATGKRTEGDRRSAVNVYWGKQPGQKSCRLLIENVSTEDVIHARTHA